MKSIDRVFFFLTVFLLGGCGVRKLPTQQAAPLQLLDVYTLPHKLDYANTTIGGLSGIDYDKAADRYYLISDDRSDLQPARFYTARIRIVRNKIDTVQWHSVTFLQQADGSTFPSRKLNPSRTPDPEGIRRLRAGRQIWWSSEGERVLTPEPRILLNPALYICDERGRVVDSLPIPPNMQVNSSEKGPRRNGVWEGLTFSEGGKKVWVCTEEPLYNDGPRAGTGDSAAWTRWTAWDTRTKKLLGQYAYRIDPVVDKPEKWGDFQLNGVPEILWVKGSRFLAVERSFTAGIRSSAIRIYLCDTRGASDVSAASSLEQADFIPIKKDLLLDLRTLDRFVDNVEGICFGPLLPDGRQSLLLVTDDNFSPEQQTQFFLFALKGLSPVHAGKD